MKGGMEATDEERRHRAAEAAEKRIMRERREAQYKLREEHRRAMSAMVNDPMIKRGANLPSAEPVIPTEPEPELPLVNVDPDTNVLQRKDFGHTMDKLEVFEAELNSWVEGKLQQYDTDPMVRARRDAKFGGREGYAEALYRILNEKMANARARSAGNVDSGTNILQREGSGGFETPSPPSAAGHSLTAPARTAAETRGRRRLTRGERRLMWPPR